MLYSLALQVASASFHQEYFKLRTAHVSTLKAAGEVPYPHKFHVSISLTEFIEQYSKLADGEHHTDVISVAGLFSLRVALVIRHLMVWLFLFSESSYSNPVTAWLHICTISIVYCTVGTVWEVDLLMYVTLCCLGQTKSSKQGYW